MVFVGRNSEVLSDELLVVFEKALESFVVTKDDIQSVEHFVEREIVCLDTDCLLRFFPYLDYFQELGILRLTYSKFELTLARKFKSSSMFNKKYSATFPKVTISL